jgi:hypothetical protein
MVKQGIRRAGSYPIRTYQQQDSARIFARMSAKSKETAKSLLLALESQDRGEEDNGKHDKPGKRRRT